MNKYGYFTFDDFPADAYSSFVAEVGTRQQGANDAVMFDRFEPEGYERWATFEEGEFDFVKPLYTGASGEKIADVSDFISDETGELSETFQVIVGAGDTYSGSGFSVRTFNDDYTIEISVTDSNGTRSKTFDKTDDEFYPMPYNGLQSVNFIVRNVKPHHFMSFIGYSFGGVRKLQEADFVDDPVITNVFDVTSESLEYDTLDLNIRGDKENFNIIAGERITYSKTGQEFFVYDAHQNNNGTIDITCYDHILRMEETAYGTVIVESRPAYVVQWIQNLFGMTGEVDVPSTLSTPLVSEQTWAGYFDTTTFRDAVRMLMQGNGLAVQRIGKFFRVFAPYIVKNSTARATFNETNIVETPEIEIDEQVYKVHFTKYKMKVDNSEKVELYHGDVQYQEDEVLEFTEPAFSNSTATTHGYTFKAIISEDQDNPDNDVLQQLDASTVNNYLVTEWGQYDLKIYNNILISGNPMKGLIILNYPYKVKQGVVGCTLPNVPTIFRKNIVDLTDCTLMIYSPTDVTIDGVTTTYKEAFRKHLRYIYSLNKKITFRSILNAFAGDYVRVKYDNVDHYGWISRKTDNLNGVYEYEVVCK